MKRKMLGLILLMFVFASCTNSMENDAREAAELQRISMEYAINKDFKEAENAFVKSQKILNKYRQTPDFSQFEALYNTYLMEGVGK